MTTLADLIGKWAKKRERIVVIYDTSGSMQAIQPKVWGLHRDLGPVLEGKIVTTGVLNLGGPIFEAGFDAEHPPQFEGMGAHKVAEAMHEALHAQQPHSVDGIVFVTDNGVGEDLYSEAPGFEKILWVMFGLEWPLPAWNMPRRGHLLAVGG